MALSPVEQRRIASLEAKIAALERLTRPASGIGQGSSTLFGSLNIRSTQLGFAAELTSTFNATTGYDWKRLALDTTGSITLTNPAIQLTGNRAYSIDGSTTLASGTKGWLEPSPESSGYLFTTASSSSAGFFARLTTSSGGNWNFYKLKLSAGSYTDDGAEVTGYNAVPLTIDGAGVPTPVSGMRVWMIPSKQSGKYEFLPYDIWRPFFVDVTTSAGGGAYTCTKLYHSGGGVWAASSDTVTAVPIDGQRSTPAGSRGLCWEQYQGSGIYFFYPFRFADVDTAGLVSDSDQFLSGRKRFDQIAVRMPGDRTYGNHSTSGAIVVGEGAALNTSGAPSGAVTVCGEIFAGGQDPGNGTQGYIGSWVRSTDDTTAGFARIHGAYRQDGINTYRGPGLSLYKLTGPTIGSGINGQLHFWLDSSGNGQLEISPQSLGGDGDLNLSRAGGGAAFSVNGNRGIDGTKTFDDNGGNTHDVTITGGIVTAWDVTAYGGELTGFAAGTELIRFRNPKPLNLTPTAKTAIVTAATGRRGRELLEVSGPLLRAYAARLGADFVTLTRKHPSYALSVKWGIRRVLEHYERIVFLDADILVPADAPDLFDLCRVSHIGASDELPWLTMANPKVLDEYQRVRTGQGKQRVPCSQYFNSGVIVASQYHADLFGPPPGPAPVHHCLEQHWWNARLYDTATPVTVLPREANWQWWTDREFKVAPSNAMLHFSGIQSHTSRMRYMKQFAAKLSS